MGQVLVPFFHSPHCFFVANHRFAIQLHLANHPRLLQYLRMFVFPVSTQVVV